MEGHQIAITLVKNQNLIAQRIELQINKANMKAIKKINEVQDDMNRKLQDFKNKFDEFLNE